MKPFLNQKKNFSVISKFKIAKVLVNRLYLKVKNSSIGLKNFLGKFKKIFGNFFKFESFHLNFKNNNNLLENINKLILFLNSCINLNFKSNIKVELLSLKQIFYYYY